MLSKIGVVAWLSCDKCMLIGEKMSYLGMVTDQGSKGKTEINKSMTEMMMIMSLMVVCMVCQPKLRLCVGQMTTLLNKMEKVRSILSEFPDLRYRIDEFLARCEKKDEFLADVLRKVHRCWNHDIPNDICKTKLVLSHV